ncbi:MAG: GNAT family N-acetyltransferase [Chloroflexi bacterium]|nr:MAG: GNAT family N-acetyltransferase [Chloroflexota bacterium]
MFTKAQTILRDLGNGLVMRRSTSADAEALAEFHGQIHGENEADRQRVAAWTRDLVARPHPTFHPDDFIIVEETSTGRIVSSLSLIPQTWTYEGIEFGVGRPELVATLPEFRDRGLIRLQFEEVHKWSVERGLLVQIITGIPYYYRLFGYEMALDLDGGRTGYEANVPRLKEGQAEESFCFRPASESDIPFIMEMDQASASRSLISAVRDVVTWKYELGGRSENNIHNEDLEVIERMDSQEPVGVLARLHSFGNHALRYELKPGISWLDVTPGVVRYLWNIAKQMPAEAGKTQSSFTFLLGAEPPVYQALGNDLPGFRKPYAYFMRVADLIGFIRLIAPVLEQRLASSIAPGYSGELKISFYRGGMHLLFEKGKIQVEAWKPTPAEWGNAAFPDLTFLQILFGYRSFAELHQSFADCWWKTEKDRALIDILFPKKHSHVIGIA